jgi:UDP-2,3-diacylglucosamine pyrophosphatase LpxH
MLRRPIDIAVISDVHLGTYGCHATELLSYLQSISPQILILNGDIIDGWQFSKRYFPAAHLAVLREIINFISSGIRVIYITGNHDEMLRRYADLHISNFILADKFLLEVNGKTIWLFHGDVFDNTTKGSAKVLARLGGYGYDLLILLNRMINFISKSFGGEKLSFSKKIKNSVKKAIAYINKFEEIVAELAIEKNMIM